MATIALTGTDGEEIRFNVEDDVPSSIRDPGGIVPAGGGSTPRALRPAGANTAAAEVESRFSDYFDPIRSLANQLAAKINEVDVKPSEVEVTVGVKVTAKTGVVFVSAGADAEMTVKMAWKTEKSRESG